ncbi:hypothetical protein B296_00020046 [Ensete ventricosum]|uniref:Uncharacterized protein n=1 Tax=Ensete ventricosum TaxID=4639 RepID=A0A426ZKM3_ENSVE|nr:hypothetical protein B296_00020046 [Ensete ventricosum]
MQSHPHHIGEVKSDHSSGKRKTATKEPKRGYREGLTRKPGRRSNASGGGKPLSVVVDRRPGKVEAAF